MNTHTDSLIETFHFEAEVAPTEAKLISRHYFVPENYEIYHYDKPIIYTKLGYTDWEDIYIDPHERNVLIIKAHVQGKNETEQICINVERKIKGIMKAAIKVYARRLF